MTGFMFSTFHNALALTKSKSDGKAHEVISALVKSADHAAKFVFVENWEILSGLHEFGLTLVGERLFRLPFPVCYFQYSLEHWHIGLFAQQFEDKLSGDCEIQCVAAQKHIPSKAVQICHPSRIALFYGEGPSIAVAQSTDADAAPQTARQSAVNRSIELLSFVGFLNSKGTKMETVSPREGVNAKREKQGKRPIPEYTVVRIDPEIIKTYTAKGGTHASPRPHLRRGHIRRLDEERKTVVRPTFVNATDNLPPPPQYRVEKA